jgi:hypothetical protein
MARFSTAHARDTQCTPRPTDDVTEDRMILSFTLLLSVMISVFVISLDHAVANSSILSLWN